MKGELSELCSPYHVTKYSYDALNNLLNNFASYPTRQ